MKMPLKQVYQHIRATHFGVFGSALRKPTAHDLDIFLFCRNKNEAKRLYRKLSFFPNLVALSYNQYGTGGSGGRRRALDITIFDNEQNLQVFMDYDRKEVRSNVSYKELLCYWNKVV